jgi:hypothetical protein
MKHEPDAQLFDLLAKWRKARKDFHAAGKQAVTAKAEKACADLSNNLTKIERSICKARAQGYAGLFVQSLLLCSMVEEGDINDDLIRLARNIRQTMIAQIKGSGVRHG